MKTRTIYYFIQIKRRAPGEDPPFFLSPSSCHEGALKEPSFN
jgi:hypothetical protein